MGLGEVPKTIKLFTAFIFLGKCFLQSLNHVGKDRGIKSSVRTADVSKLGGCGCVQASSQ